MAQAREKLAVVLFNLGGPDGQEAVRPFLRNLFRDPAIIQAPVFVREPLAWLISTLRDKSARENYAKMGGGSPLLPETEKQARALESALATILPHSEIRAFPAMRYWHPFTEDVARDVTDWGADRVLLLPLYPQFSTTTTGSSLAAWTRVFDGETVPVCCYPDHPKFVSAHADLIRKSWEEAGKPTDVRLLFSAHGLPEKVINAGGDPYQMAGGDNPLQAIARRHCRKSRIGRSVIRAVSGPLKWIGPSTDDADRCMPRREKRHILLVPIAFVSEHIETLVELDEEYAELAAGLRRMPDISACRSAWHASRLYCRAWRIRFRPCWTGSMPILTSPSAARQGGMCPAVHSCVPVP